MASMSSAALGKLVLVQVPLSNETTTWKWVGLWSVLIGHMRVQKLSLSKWGQVYNLSCENDFYFAWEWKIIPLSKTEYLTSFWYRGPGDLEIAYCCTVNSKIPLELMQLWTSPYWALTVVREPKNRTHNPLVLGSSPALATCWISILGHSCK